MMSAMVRYPCALACGGAVDCAFDQTLGLVSFLAEVHAHQVVLENIVIEHILGRFTEIDDPLGNRRRLDPECHVLSVGGAGGMVVAADAADGAGDEVSVARVFALHENAVPAKNRRSAVTLDHMLVLEIDFGKNAQAAHNAGDRVPVHFHQVPLFAGNILCRCGDSAHCDRSFGFSVEILSWALQ
jgi:hypothetical protein